MRMRKAPITAVVLVGCLGLACTAAIAIRSVFQPTASGTPVGNDYGFRIQRLMITVGSVTREAAAEMFPFLAQRYPGRRTAIKEFTHRDPDFVFWIYPDGRLHDARDSHARNLPRGYEYIVDDEPDYGGFLRGRVASLFQDQLVVVYCREEALAALGARLTQLVHGLTQLPIGVREEALIISDNGDVYGTWADVKVRKQAERS